MSQRSSAEEARDRGEVDNGYCDVCDEDRGCAIFYGETGSVRICADCARRALELLGGDR